MTVKVHRSVLATRVRNAAKSLMRGPPALDVRRVPEWSACAIDWIASIDPMRGRGRSYCATRFTTPSPARRGASLPRDGSNEYVRTPRGRLISLGSSPSRSTRRLVHHVLPGGLIRPCAEATADRRRSCPLGRDSPSIGAGNHDTDVAIFREGSSREADWRHAFAPRSQCGLAHRRAARWPEPTIHRIEPRHEQDARSGVRHMTRGP